MSASPTTTMTAPSTSSSNQRPPMRNKSSSQLSSTTTRSNTSSSTHKSHGASAAGGPKRNKSSSSLHSTHHHAPGHHTVSFQHHGHSSRRNSHGHSYAAKRTNSQSGGRRPAFGFGMTSMNSDDSVQTTTSSSAGTGSPVDTPGPEASTSDQTEDGKGQDGRPGFERSNTSERTLTGEARGRSRSKSRERDASNRRSSRSKNRRSRDQSREQGKSSRSPARRRTERDHEADNDDAGVQVTIQDVTPVPTPMSTPPADQNRSRAAAEQQAHLLDTPNNTVASSLTSNATSTSEWESATDSPAPPPSRQLPKIEASGGAGQPYRPETNSGLAQVMSEGDRIASEGEIKDGVDAKEVEAVVVEQQQKQEAEAQQAEDAEPTPVTSSDALPVSGNVKSAQELQLAAAAQKPPAQKPRKGRAKFEIEDSEDTPPSPEQVRQLNRLQKADQLPLEKVAKGETVAETPADSKAPSPTPPPLTDETTKASKSEPAADTSPRYPFPPTATTGTTSQPPSPSATRRLRTGRKSSNASIMSTTSNRSMALSFAGRMGPPGAASTFRRAPSVVAPSVDRGTVASAELLGSSPDLHQHQANTGASGSASRHRRTESLSSVQSLRSVAETQEVGGKGKGRASTMGPSTGRDAAQRLRMSSGASESTSALAALQGAAKRDGLTTPGLGGMKRNASGYFSALRGFTTGLTTGFVTPPLSPGMSSAATSIPPGSSAYGAAGKGKSRASQSPAQFVTPIVSKFVEPPPAPPPPTFSTSPQQMLSRQLSSGPDSTSSATPRDGRSHLHMPRNQSSASLSGAMSRTQQKALLARDAPYPPRQHDGGAPGGSGSSNTAAAAAGPSGSTTGGFSSAANMHYPLPLPPPPTQQLLMTSTSSSAASPAQQGPYASAAQQSAATRMSRTPSGQQSAAAASSAAAQAAAAQAAAGEARQQGMQKWAFGLVREAERIERQYRAVEKWRDPLGESLERVLARRRVRAEIKGGKGGSGSSTPAVGGGGGKSSGGGQMAVAA